MSLSLALGIIFSLSIPVGAVTNESIIESQIENAMVEDIFRYPNTCQIFDAQGTDITESFISRHQNDYESGNFSDIINETFEQDITVFCPVTPSMDEISPYLLVNYTASGKIYQNYVYNSTKYKATISLQMKATVNDSTNTFSTINEPTITNISGSHSLEGNWSTTQTTTSSGGKVCNKKGVLNLYCNGNLYYAEWMLTASTSSTTLSGTLLGSPFL